MTKRSGEKNFGIDAGFVQRSDGGLHRGQILAVGHAVPRLVGMQDADAAKTLVDLRVCDRREEKFAFFRVDREIFVQKLRENAVPAPPECAA